MSPDDITIEFTVDNVYADGTVTRDYVEPVEPPAPGDDDLEDWAEDVLFPFTGTGRTEGDAGYFLKITACERRPELVGRTFEWGV